MNASQRILLWFLAALVALVTLPARASSLKVGATAPAATLVTLDGKNISTESLHGQTVILTFWATWCEPCREELPLLSRYARDHRDQGLRVLAFSLDDPDRTAKVQAVADTLSFPVGLLERSQAEGYGRMWRVPVSFVIDREGLLRYDGWQAKQPVWTETSLNSVVTPLLAK
jgi:cytochrome c biogenesis protein CcmG/thiol:disulfide interchange protein DsbE